MTSFKEAAGQPSLLFVWLECRHTGARRKVRRALASQLGPVWWLVEHGATGLGFFKAFAQGEGGREAWAALTATPQWQTGSGRFTQQPRVHILAGDLAPVVGGERMWVQILAGISPDGRLEGKQLARADAWEGEGHCWPVIGHPARVLLCSSEPYDDDVWGVEFERGVEVRVAR